MRAPPRRRPRRGRWAQAEREPPGSWPQQHRAWPQRGPRPTDRGESKRTRRAGSCDKRVQRAVPRGVVPLGPGCTQRCATASAGWRDARGGGGHGRGWPWQRKWRRRGGLGEATRWRATAATPRGTPPPRQPAGRATMRAAAAGRRFLADTSYRKNVTFQTKSGFLNIRGTQGCKGKDRTILVPTCCLSAGWQGDYLTTQILTRSDVKKATPSVSKLWTSVAFLTPREPQWIVEGSLVLGSARGRFPAVVSRGK